MRGARPRLPGHLPPPTPLLGELDERDRATRITVVDPAVEAGVFPWDWHWHANRPALSKALKEGSSDRRPRAYAVRSRVDRSPLDALVSHRGNRLRTTVFRSAGPERIGRIRGRGPLAESPRGHLAQPGLRDRPTCPPSLPLVEQQPARARDLGLWPAPADVRCRWNARSSKRSGTLPESQAVRASTSTPPRAPLDGASSCAMRNPVITRACRRPD